MLRNPIFLWLGRDPLSPPLDAHMFMYLSIYINPFIRKLRLKTKIKVAFFKNSYETKLTSVNELMQHYWLTLDLRVALTLCMLSHDDIIQRGSQKETSQYIYVQDRRIFSASHNLGISACLFHIKYNVEPDKISRIMYLIMFWSGTSRSSKEKFFRTLLPTGENSWIRAWYYHKANSVRCTCSFLPTSDEKKK